MAASGAGVHEDGIPLARVLYRDLLDQRAVNWGFVWTLQNIRWSWGLIEFGRERGTLDLLRAIVQRAHQVAGGWGSHVAFVYLPSQHRFTTRLVRVEADAYRRRVLAEIGATAATVIDLTPVFERYPSPRSLFRGHYTPAGNALVAQTVLDALEARKAGSAR
jgi:hypothetical protein